MWRLRRTRVYRRDLLVSLAWRKYAAYLTKMLPAPLNRLMPDNDVTVLLVLDMHHKPRNAHALQTDGPLAVLQTLPGFLPLKCFTAVRVQLANFVSVVKPTRASAIYLQVH